MAKTKAPSPLELRKQEIRQAAEADLLTYIKLVAPHRVLGKCHEELISWWEKEDSKNYQLTLFPRDHMKSALIAYRCAWYITKRPDIRILYLSATSNLAEKQLKFIKDILTSDIHMYYWPELVNADEGKREKWTNSEIAIDHPKRKLEGIRDSTVFTGGLTTSLTGMHCDIAVLDDAVVMENAYTAEGRSKVESQYSLLSSIETADAKEWIVGTRYHPKDLYATLQSKNVQIYDKAGSIIDEEPLYEVFERAVEDRGDGTGEFLWPRQQRPDGKWFGFDREILAKKRAQYLDQTQFRAQYYNNPNDPDGGGIKRDYFQYYDRSRLKSINGKWYYSGKLLNVYAAIDLAYSIGKRRDATAIVVIGIDSDNSIFVLDIDRFQTESIKEQFEHIVASVIKWNYKKIRTEVNGPQKQIIKELKETYIKKQGLLLSIDEFVPQSYRGSKQERMDATLRPRYENRSIWHYTGGNCQILEDEVCQDHPVHDDCKDALTNAIEIATPPVAMRDRSFYGQVSDNRVKYNSRFGGVAYK